MGTRGFTSSRHSPQRALPWGGELTGWEDKVFNFLCMPLFIRMFVYFCVHLVIA